MPDFSQYGHCSPGVLTTCGMYAGGTEITPRTWRYPPAKGAAGRPMTWSHVMTSGSVVVGGSETAAECDEPPEHDADTDPTSTATTLTLSFNRTHEPYAHASLGPRDCYARRMQSIIATLRLSPWRWLLVIGVAAIAAWLIGTWSAAAIMLIVVAAAASIAGRRLGS